MFDEIKKIYGINTKIVEIQEFFNGDWHKLKSLIITEQIEECEKNNASIISIHIKVESINEESGITEFSDAFPDIKL
jgi:hypothetical protein